MVAAIKRLAYNLWWTWNPEAGAIFETLSPYWWEQSNHSAVAVLRHVSDQELRARLGDADFAARVRSVLEEFLAYMEQPETWCTAQAPELATHPIAYFSTEFGLHESLPIYSGGLGVLAGDFAKSASDLGIGFVGISLFYRQGYFQQRISANGWQEEVYSPFELDNLPFRLVTDEAGKPVETAVEIGYSIVKLRAWHVIVGRASIYLLDSNHPDNEEHFRELTARVYGGDISTRIAQEIVLGIGGVRMLRTLGIKPGLFHMNEGHSAFLALELVRERLAAGRSLTDALQDVREHCIFTTHTPVPAGHDRFEQGLMQFQLGRFCQLLNIPFEQLMAFGRVRPDNPNEPFCMTVLALKMSRVSNAVSELHGKVSREMWKDLYPNVPVEKVAIGSVTNGVHTPGWGTLRAHEFWNKRLGFDWTDRLMGPKFWEKLQDPNFASDEELWALRYTLRRELVEFARKRLREQHMRVGGDGTSVFETVLSPDVLTIGFGRRFATYKRGPLFFHDWDRAVALITNARYPIQLVFAGKAHPRDDEGKKFIQRIVEISRNPQLFGRVVFLENYDTNVARFMVSGSDIWLNTPRRPLEASGTSGMKVAIHGGLHLSTLDGWWREGYDGENGWVIGSEQDYLNWDEQDRADAESLYHTLETQIVPEFYNRDEHGIPRRWIARIRHAMQTLIPQYSSDRMVGEYVTGYYVRTGSSR